MNKKKYNIKIAILAGIILLMLDIATKLWAVGPYFKPISFIKGFFYLTNFQTNSGIAFGIGMPILLQIIGSLVIIIVLIHLANEHIFAENKRLFLKPVLFGIIVGGAIGNLVDRVLQGYVTDFIVLQPIPVFNIADAGITVGLIGLFIAVLITSKK